MVTGNETSVCVLGPLLVGDGTSTQRPGARRQRLLLSVLAAAAVGRHPVPVDTLVGAVYGAEASSGTRRALSTEIWRCRRLLGSPEAIVGDHDGYAFDLARVSVDAVRYLDLLGQGRDALQRADMVAAERVLAEAAELWRGDPIPDWRDHPDGLAFSARLVEFKLGGQEDHAEALAGMGRHRDAVALLEEITRDNPYREHAWALLVDCFAAMGDRRRARAALDSARRILAEQGVGLGVELRAARESLRADPEPRPRARSDRGLVGRVEEQNEAFALGREALRAARPDLVLVSGEAGIGKTTFVEALAADLAAEEKVGAVERISCDRRLTLPYGVIEAMITRLSGAESASSLESIMAGAHDRAATQDALASLIESAAKRLGGLVVVVDDVQWATVEVLDLLMALVARRREVPLLLLATMRDPSDATSDVRSDASSEIARLLMELRRRAAAGLTLGGLSEEQCAELLGPDLPRDTVADAHRLTGGNPLYLHSLRQADSTLFDQMPPSLGDALDEHIDSLPIDILGGLELAATIGTGFDSRVLVAAAGRLPEPIDPPQVAAALDTATRVGVLRPVGSHPARREFVHGLVRDRLYERMPRPQRVVAHAAIHDALVSATGRDAAADLVAHHAFSGWPRCPTATVVAALEAAAAESSRQLAFDMAYEHYRRALDLVDMDPDGTAEIPLDALLAAAGQAAVADADLAGARRTYRALVDHGRAHGMVTCVLEGSIGLLQTYANERVSGQALDGLADGLRALLGAGVDAAPAGLVAEALATLATYRPQDARSLAEQLIADDPSREEPLLLRIWDQESGTQKARILDRLKALGSESPGVVLRQWVGGVVAGHRRLDERPAGWSAGDGDAMARWESHLWLITVAVARGDFARADRLLDAAESQAVEAPSPLERASREASTLGQRVWLAYLRADLGTLAELFTRSPANWTVRRPIQRVLAAFSAPLLMPAEEAWRLVDEIVEEFEEGVVPGRHQLAPLIALANGCVGTGHERGIALCRRRLQDHRGEHGLFYFGQYWGCTEYHLARLAAIAGDLDEAVELFEEALVISRRVGARCFETWALRALATVRHSRDRDTDRAEAPRLDDEARALATEIGMGGVVAAPWPPTGVLDLRWIDGV